MNSSFDSGWYIIYVKSHFEKRVYDSLMELSIDSFLPLVKTIRKWSDRKKIIYKPLFSSYVFVNIKSKIDFHKALSINGAFSYIKFGKEYGKVPSAEINKIKLLIQDEKLSDLELTSSLPKIGEMKKIAYGSLNGLECEILKTNNINKIIVRINSLNQNITASIPLSYLQEIEKIS